MTKTHALTGYADIAVAQVMHRKGPNRPIYLLAVSRACYEASVLGGYRLRDIAAAITDSLSYAMEPTDESMRASVSAIPLNAGGAHLSETAVSHRVQTYADMLRHDAVTPNAADVAFKLCSSSGPTLRFRNYRDALVLGGVGFVEATEKVHRDLLDHLGRKGRASKVRK